MPGKGIDTDLAIVVNAQRIQPDADLRVRPIEPRPRFDEAADLMRTVSQRSAVAEHITRQRFHQSYSAKRRVQAGALHPVLRRKVAVFAQVLAHTGVVDPQFDAECLEPIAITDARQFEQFGRFHRARTQDDLAARPNVLHAAFQPQPHPAGAGAVEQHAFDHGIGQDRQVGALANRIEERARR